MNPYAIWVTIQTGRYLITFSHYDDAVLYVIRYGGGLEIIENTYENY
jgi:hypothetical protein